MTSEAPTRPVAAAPVSEQDESWERARRDPATLEAIFRGCLRDHDVKAAVAALTLLAVVDPHRRADELREQVRAVLRMLLDSGDITPMGVRMIEKVLNG